jgi:plasmid stabilization system protein ParE
LKSLAGRFIVTPAALRDLDSISSYIEEQSGPRRADEIETRLFQAFADLARRPGIGHRRQDLTGRDVRFFTVHSWLVMYDYRVRPLRILAILHGARDVSTILARRRR